MKAGLSEKDRIKLIHLLSLTTPQSHPNANPLNEITRNISILSLNIKSMGYELARQMSAALPIPSGTTPSVINLQSKASTQADIESDWVAHWCEQLHISPFYHRKLWELAYVLQALWEHGMLEEGKRGLGFGCGAEPLPSIFAERGISTVITDLPQAEAQSRGWVDTNQHAGTLTQCYQADLVSWETFSARTTLRAADMNAIPADFRDFDFCWSICALEHLGSIAKGLAFVENSLATLKPGGIAVHTTEFNINSDGPTIDDWQTVLFQRQHFEILARKLTEQGDWVAPLDFTLGDQPLDRFVDLPPYSHDLPPELAEWIGAPLHLKVATDGFICTCFGMIVRKGMAKDSDTAEMPLKNAI